MQWNNKHPFLLSFSVSVMNKGQCVTKYYRWIQKNGGYIWIQSSATIAVNVKNASEKNIIWVNYVLRSEVNNVIMILWYNGMVEQSKKLPPTSFSLLLFLDLNGNIRRSRRIYNNSFKRSKREAAQRIQMHVYYTLKQMQMSRKWTTLLHPNVLLQNFTEFYRDKNLCRLIKETKHI